LHRKSSGHPGRENAASCLVRHEISIKLFDNGIGKCAGKAPRKPEGADYTVRALLSSNDSDTRKQHAISTTRIMLAIEMKKPRR
jgi:hypothetical protein